jgi:hypothetical protein
MATLHEKSDHAAPGRAGADELAMGKEQLTRVLTRVRVFRGRHGPCGNGNRAL